MSSLAIQVAMMSDQDRQKWYSSFTEQELQRLIYNYNFWARPKQLFPEGDWRTWLLLSGRGFGKTFVGSNWVIRQAQIQKYPIALIGNSAADVRDYMIESGTSSILHQSPPWFRPEYQPSKRRLVFPNGVIAIAYSGDKPDQLRGFNGASAWIDELGKYRYPDYVWDNLNFALRLGAQPKVVITTTPRPTPLIKSLIKDESVIKTYGTTDENKANLAESFIEFIYSKYQGTRLGRQELLGELLEDTPGTLWTYSLLDSSRHLIQPRLKKVIIAVDPAVSANDNSNSTGIIVCGLDELGRGVVLEDKSGVYSPKQWADVVINLYTAWEANEIVAEANQGGDLVKSNIQQASDQHLPITLVHATRGKYTRAEPISTLYEKKLIYHHGTFAELEDQMCTWLPGDKSPDRLDAMVWGFTHLMLKKEELTEIPLW